VNNAVSVVGLGKLGLCLAACFAWRGVTTVGVDVQEEVVAAVNRGESPLVEPSLAEMIAATAGKCLTATIKHADAINRTDTTFILTATPSNPDGSFSNYQVESALTALAQAFGASGKKGHLFVISSTVVPGSVEESFIPLLERFSGRRLNSDFHVCYDPDFVALGEVVRGFLEPELIVIGESSPDAGERVAELHRRICLSTPHIARMSIVSAELAKVSLNAYITLKISFANTLTDICGKIRGADVDAITSALGADRRISPHYFRGGLSFGGTCFPRDTKAFMTVAERYGNRGELIRATDTVNREWNERLIEEVDRLATGLQKPIIGVLGLAFKSGTPVIEESPAMKLVIALSARGRRVAVYDPLAGDNAREILGNAVLYMESAEECLNSSDLIVVASTARDYVKSVENFVPQSTKVILDCWRALDPHKLSSRLLYNALGRWKE
jgi:UDPglucose 6-dehydrogenase